MSGSQFWVSSRKIFISEVQPTLLKGSALPQKRMIKRPKNYKWNTEKKYKWIATKVSSKPPQKLAMKQHNS